MIKRCEQYAHEFDIIFNPYKSKLIDFGRNNVDIPVFVRGSKVQCVEHEKHLGNML